MTALLLAQSVQATSEEGSNRWDKTLGSTLSRGFDTGGLVIIGAGILGVVLLQPLDQRVKDSVGGNQLLSEGASRVGDVLGTGIPGLMLALTQLQTDSIVGRTHIEALTLTFVTTFGLKYLNGRIRPTGSNRHSMPSGHTSTAFATATVMAYSYGYKVGIPAYLTAIYVGLSRISDDKHWLSDVVAGAAIGIFWGRSAALRHLNFKPVLSHNSVGFLYEHQF